MTRFSFETNEATKKAMKQIAENEDYTLKDKMHTLIYDEISNHIDAGNVEESDPELIEAAIQLREDQAESEREKQAEFEKRAVEHAEEVAEIEDDIKALEALHEEAIAAQDSYEDDIECLVVDLVDGDLTNVMLTSETVCIQQVAEDHDCSVETVLDDLHADDRLSSERFPNRKVTRMRPEVSSDTADNDKTETYDKIIAENTA